MTSSPSDTPALTEGVHEELRDRLIGLAIAAERSAQEPARLLFRPADTWDAIAEAFRQSAGAITALQADLQRYRSLFDAAGNYIPHSQVEGDLRASQARIDALTAEVARKDEALKGAKTLAGILVWPLSLGPEVTAALKKRLAAIDAALSPVKQEPNDVPR